ncbi:MAG: acyl-CoA dehydrogenase C-terminal domain-containing protein [Acidobacteria bacterium]|nr:acyl-CoA dehydrogenase C-terminal domain-containing protein [Acidobacteriota bacterium]
MKEKAESLFSDKEFAIYAKNLAVSADLTIEVCEKAMAKEKDLLFISMNATPILQMFAETLGGYFLLNQAEIARKKLVGIKSSSNKDENALLQENENARYYHNKILSAKFFCSRILPYVQAKMSAIEEDKSAVEQIL